MTICPQCGSENITRDEVDIGVGVQVGPWSCFDCGWSEVSLGRKNLELVDDEKNDQ